MTGASASMLEESKANRLYPMSGERGNVRKLPSIFHDVIDTDQKYEQTDNIVDDKETKPVIRTNMITHQHNIDTSH